MEVEIQKWIRRKTKANNEGNLEQMSYACSKLAELYFKQNNYKGALQEYKEEATLHEVQANKIKLAVSYRMIGEVLGAMGNYKEALKHQMKYLDLAKEERDQIEEQRALATIGRTYFCQAESNSNENDEYRTLLTNAKNAYKKSLALCEQLTGIGKQELCQMRARLLLNIGLVQECQHENDKAVDSIQKAIKLCKEYDIFEDMYRCYSSLGMLYYRQKNTAKALSLLELALDVAGRLDDKVELCCETLLNKADVLFSLADFQRAKQVLRKAYKLRTPIAADRQAVERNLKVAVAMCGAQESLLRIPDTDLAAKKKLYETMGDGCVAVKNYTAALEYYHKMEAMTEALGEVCQELATVYVSLAQTYRDNGQYEQALKYFYKELELWKDNPPEACNTMLNIGEVLELSGKSSEKVYEDARRLAQQACNTKLEIAALQALVNAGRHQMSEDLEILRQAEPSGSEDEEASPDFGHDVCLDSSTDEEEYDRSSTTRKRPRRLPVRRNEKGETQLHVACINGNVTVVKRLVEQGHPVNVRDHCGWLPLHEACNHGHKDIVEFLLDNGAAINDPGGVQCGGVTPLHDAASCGNLSVIELLLDRGAAVAGRTNEGDTALDCLVKWRARSKPKFDSIELTFFQEIENRLRENLHKAGHTNPRRETTMLRDTTPILPRSGQDSRNRRRILDDEEEDEYHIQNISDLEENVSDSASSTSSSIAMPRSRTPDAAKEYQNVMTMLRTKDKQTSKPVFVSTETNEQRAFLKDEDVGEDWLEQDIPTTSRPKKKKRLSSPIERHRLKFVSAFGERRSTLETENDLSNEDIILPDDSRPEANIVTVSQKKKTSCRVMDEFVEQVPRIIDNTSENSAEIVESGRSQQTVERQLLSVRVCIEDKMLLVPVQRPHEQNIRWLAQEAAKRYANMEGIHPTLKLLTKDGAFLSEDDPVSVVNNEEVTSEVTSWNIPPLTDRYMEACKILHSDPDQHLISCLEESQATQLLQLSDLCLMPGQVAPLFRALKRQHTLHSLVLAGNCLGDEGMKLLAAGLKSLGQLQQLDLSCNNITAEGVSYCISELPAQLSNFCLSHNPLGNASVESLSKLPSLECLYLQNCDFSSNFITSQCLNSLIELDVSYNSLGGSCITEILNQLDTSRIEILNLAATNLKAHSPAIHGLICFLNRAINLPKLKVLDLSDCSLRDEDVQNLLTGLQHCPVLETLTLESNRELSSLSLRRLLQRKPVLRSLKLAGCCNINNYLEDGFIQRWISWQGLESLSLNCQEESELGISVLWKEMWGDRASVLKCPAGLLNLSLK